MSQTQSPEIFLAPEPPIKQEQLRQIHAQCLKKSISEISRMLEYVETMASKYNEIVLFLQKQIKDGKLSQEEVADVIESCSLRYGLYTEISYAVEGAYDARMKKFFNITVGTDDLIAMNKKVIGILSKKEAGVPNKETPMNLT